MNEILVIPDIHGRNFWIEPCQKWQGSIVFLGDYHDPYPDEVTTEQSLENLQKLVEFYEENSDRVTTLIGNHDANYLIKPNFSNRQDNQNYNEVKDLLPKLNLKVVHRVNNVLFSHSGILPLWLDSNNLTLADLYDMPLTNPALLDISPFRGGYSVVGGPLFGDLRDYIYLSHIPDIYQIFGHTQLREEPVIQKDFADLDCRKCFVADTKTLKIEPYA